MRRRTGSDCRARGAGRGLLRLVGIVCVWAAAQATGCDRSGPPASTEHPIFRETRPSGVKVMLIGIDGATFDVIGPMVGEGKLPEFKRLMESGTWAPLRSEEPMLSPAIWTTVATGRFRQAHGIEDFVSHRRGDGKEPVLTSSAERQTLALWNIVGPFRRTVGVVGWWVTWPAEPVRGFVVSDRVAHSRWQSWTEGATQQYLTSPPGLFDEIKQLIVDPARPPMDEINQLVELTDAERMELTTATKPILFHGPSVFKFGYCEQRTYEKIALHQLERGQPDLNMIFLIAIDPISHTFWHYFQPERFGAGVDPAEAARLGKLIRNMYEHDDRYLKQLLSLASPDTVVMIVSDHGFQASGRLPGTTSVIDYRVVGIERTERLDRPVNVGMTGIHHVNGVLIAAGGPIVRGATLRAQPSVADIAPTILALMGLPVAKDFSGRVLEELIDPAFLERHPIRTIDSYENLIDREELTRAAQADESQRLEYLRSLGYID